MGNEPLIEQYQLKPQLLFVGKLYGMDLYADVSQARDPSARRKLLEKLIDSIASGARFTTLTKEAKDE